MVFGQKLEFLFLCSFSEKQSETGFFVTFWIENLPIQTRKTLILKIRKLAFFHRRQSIVFAQKQDNFFLFSFSAKYSKTKCFLSQSTVVDEKLEILSFFFSSKIVQNKVFCDIVDQEIQPFKTTKHGFTKVENFAFSIGVSLWFLVKNLNFFSVVFLAKYSEANCFVTFQLEKYPF